MVAQRIVKYDTLPPSIKADLLLVLKENTDPACHDSLNLPPRP